MRDFPGYTSVEQVEETLHSTVYRARKADRQGTVIIKALKAQNPSLSEIARLKHEYELIRNLDMDGIVRVHDVIDHEGLLALVLEDFGGVSLREFIRGGFTLARFLDLALRLADILGGLHQNNITHRDIKPGNILFNWQENILKITDFGIASEITRLSDEIYNPTVIKGTLAYMSPEQTGRINCAVDYRSDLYSLGITFYEMLTGGVPFMAKDPMEIIHGHIAKMPVAPKDLNPDIPAVVSDIVVKLLSKSAEERYQNSFGLKHDLEECILRLERDGRVDPFELGKGDISLKFNIPQILVGRDGDLACLYQAFDEVNDGAVKIMLVTGEPGIGKSALVSEIRKPIVGRRGYFLTGKYDQLRKFVPYSAIIQAFQGLARHLLTESGERLNMWKARILSAVGSNGRIITDAIPEMELVIGGQPDLPELGIEETQNRFNMIFKGFIRVFADGGHPLVLFLDDLQWADSASMSLIRTIMQDLSLSHFLLIGAYRDTEVDEHHLLMLTLDEIRKTGSSIQTLKLDPLGKEDINSFITSLFRCDAHASSPLAGVIFEKTLGNPFFVNQFLKTLYEEKYLSVEAACGWKWDVEAVRGLMVTENVVELMSAKITRLPKAGQEVIEVCASIGNTFDLETLSSVLDRPIDETLYIMDELIGLGLINYSNLVYRFHHDRIQEAAYSLIPAGERPRLHLRIGRRLLETTPSEEVGAKVFTIVDQLNHAHGLMETQRERDVAAALNLQAGIKAKEATAYSSAADYLKAGMEFLPAQAWEEQYQLAYPLLMERMECEYLNRNFKQAEELFEEIVRNTKDKMDRVKAYQTMVVLFTNMGKPAKAIDLGIEGLKTLGVSLSKDTGKGAVLAELIKLKLKLRKIRLEDILDMPRMENREKMGTAELFGAVGLPAYYTNPNLFAVTVLKGINMDMVYGVTRTTAFGFIAVATIMGSALNDHASAYKIAEMALMLNEKLDEKAYACKVNFVFAFLIHHWSRPMRDGIQFYKKAFQHGLDSGDLIYCGHCITAMNLARIIMGDNIDDVLSDQRRFKGFITGIKDPFVACEYAEITQLCLNLKGLTESPSSLNSDGYDEEAEIAGMRRRGTLMNVFFLLLSKEKIHYNAGLYETAYRVGFELDTMLEIPTGSYHLWEHVFYRSLSLIAVYPEKDAAEKRTIRRILKKMRKKMKTWAQSSPANFLHKSLLIEAEAQALMKGNFEKAAGLYRKAIRSAREHGYVNNEALASERAALFYTGRGFDEIGEVYAGMAYKAYGKWGATLKVRDLEKKYPCLKPHEGRSCLPLAPDSESIGSTSSSLLDLSTVMQVSQAISSEIMLDRLLKEVMRMALVNAGAQKGFFILDTDGQLTIEAAYEEGSEDIRMLHSIPVDESEELSVAIVHYAHRSGENVILGNASQEGAYVSDLHVLRGKCKSILAAPIMNKGKASGILYMENNLVENAFTPERVELLRIISAQAAISLENARLFELATTDGLTRLFTHRYFQILLEREISRSKRTERPFSLIMMDIDDFKGVNDTFGHQAGDEVLKGIARTIRSESRTIDIAARYGGEEFVLILPETDMTGALSVAEKIRKAVEETVIPIGEEAVRVSLSSGIATFLHHAAEKEDLIRSADQALYASKRSGKNRVSVGEKVSLSPKVLGDVPDIRTGM